MNLPQRVDELVGIDLAIRPSPCLIEHPVVLQRERRVLLGAACLVCNGSSTAYDPAAGKVYADVAPGTLMVGFAPGTDHAAWLAPIGDGVHYQPVAIADGASDATAMLASNGVSVANHTDYVAAGSRIIAFRPLGLL